MARDYSMFWAPSQCTVLSQSGPLLLVNEQACLQGFSIRMLGEQMAQSSRVTAGLWNTAFMRVEAGLGQPAEEDFQSPRPAATGGVSVHGMQNMGGIRLAKAKIGEGQCSQIKSVVSKSPWRESIDLP